MWKPSCYKSQKIILSWNEKKYLRTASQLISNDELNLINNNLAMPWLNPNLWFNYLHISLENNWSLNMMTNKSL